MTITAVTLPELLNMASTISLSILSTPFFNHSCQPNVTYKHSRTGPDSILRMKTIRKVKAGEELFINYLPREDLALHVSERQKRLRPWFGHDCQCVKCVEDMANENEGEFGG